MRQHIQERLKLNSNGTEKAAPAPRRAYSPQKSRESVLEMVSKMTIAQIGKLTGLSIKEAEAYRARFFRFAEQNAVRFPKWRTEFDAFVDFRLEELNERETGSSDQAA